MHFREASRQIVERIGGVDSSAGGLFGRVAIKGKTQTVRLTAWSRQDSRNSMPTLPPNGGIRYVRSHDPVATRQIGAVSHDEVAAQDAAGFKPTLPSTPPRV